VLKVQTGLTYVANEVVVLMTIGGADAWASVIGNDG
jgi:hypothetical protein